MSKNWSENKLLDNVIAIDKAYKHVIMQFVIMQFSTIPLVHNHDNKVQQLGQCYRTVTPDFLRSIAYISYKHAGALPKLSTFDHLLSL